MELAWFHEYVIYKLHLDFIRTEIAGTIDHYGFRIIVVKNTALPNPAGRYNLIRGCLAKWNLWIIALKWFDTLWGLKT